MLPRSFMKSPRSQYEDCPEELIPTRKSLLGRLRNWEDQESWRTFFDTYWRLIYNFALHRGLGHEEAQEVVQETVLAVAKNMARFHYDPAVCSFKTWLLGVTRSKIANQYARRARHPVCEAPGPRDSSRPASDPMDAAGPGEWERKWEEEWEKHLMETALQRVKRRVSIEQYQMFDLFVLKQWPAMEVAKTLGTTVAHVYVAKHRVSKWVRQEIQALEASGR